MLFNSEQSNCISLIFPWLNINYKLYQLVFDATLFFLVDNGNQISTGIMPMQFDVLFALRILSQILCRGKLTYLTMVGVITNSSGYHFRERSQGVTNLQGAY